MVEKKFFSETDENTIAKAIAEAESKTSGEIRVYINKNAGDDPLMAARYAFENIGMRKTELRNGILFYLAVEDRTFAILGDDGINDKVPPDLWNQIKDTVISSFRQGEFARGLADGIKMAGQQLAEFFPHSDDDVNELPDAVVYSDDKGGNNEA